MKKILISFIIVVGLILIFLGSYNYIKKILTKSVSNNFPPVITTYSRRFYKDIPYATQSQAQKLDIALPDTGKGPFPVIIGIHGGAFKFGDKSWIGAITLQGVKYGYAVVNINYRLSGEAKWPAPINDMKAAIRWVKFNSKKYNINPDKIALWGDSAGGHLAALAGTSGDVSKLEDYNLAPEAKNESSNVQVVIDWYGPNDFLKIDELMLKEGYIHNCFDTIDDYLHYYNEIVINEEYIFHHNEATNLNSEEMGFLIYDYPEKVKLTNPNSYIKSGDKNFPAFLIQHGDKDEIIPYLGSKELYEKIKAAGYGDRTVLETFHNAHHSDRMFCELKNVNRIFIFLNKYLKK